MAPVTVQEKNRIDDTMLYWVLLVFRGGVSPGDLNSFLSLLSKYLDTQFEETSAMIAEGQEGSSKESFLGEQVRWRGTV